MIRVTLDSNEYISAFNFRGKALDLIHQAISGEIEIAISEPILAETMRVLREKFEWQPYEIHALRQRLLKTCKLVEPKMRVSVLGDEPDDRILDCSQEAGSQFIITEDRAMLRAKEHAGAKIVTVAEFLAAGRRGLRRDAGTAYRVHLSQWRLPGGSISPGDGRGELSEEELKIQEFIANRGVTKCPGAFTPEMAELNRQREINGWHAEQSAWGRRKKA